MFGPDFIFQKSVLCIMLTSVKFNYKPCSVTIKIGNVIIDYFLAKKTDGISFQKIVPKMFFFLGHIFRSAFAFSVSFGLCWYFIYESLHRFAVPLPLTREAFIHRSGAAFQATVPC